VVVALSVVLFTQACGGGSDRPSGQPIPATDAGARLTGSLTVFAAASLTEAFEDDKSQLERDNTGLSITYSFAGSQQLVAQIAAGAPADVVATADQDSMGRLVTAGLVETPKDFARNRLQIVVAPGNPRRINSLSDLGRNDLRVVLADASVPAGRYGRQALDRAGVAAKPVSLELDVKAVLQKVTSGDADAGLVYATDVSAAGSKVTGVEIPPEQNVLASYPVAVVKATRNKAAAQGFVAQLIQGPGQRALLSRGFLTA
jgi:molybdate transport system substrate-binding protein